MGAAFDGIDVFVSGTVPSDAEVLVRVQGKKIDQHFKEQGKALGLLWMNTNTVEMHNVPSIMILAMSEKLLQENTAQSEQWLRLGLGFDALKSTIKVLPEDADKDMLFKELLKLKEEEGLYSIQKAAVQYTKKENSKSFQAIVHFPSALSEGMFTIETFAVQDGIILGQDKQTINAKMKGMPSLLFQMAMGHALLYGILAVLVAIFAGIFTGYLFRGGQEGAH
jgi:uncharacterized protein (TIGR02186 family)